MKVKHCYVILFKRVTVSFLEPLHQILESKVQYMIKALILTDFSFLDSQYTIETYYYIQYKVFKIHEIVLLNLLRNLNSLAIVSKAIKNLEICPS